MTSECIYHYVYRITNIIEKKHYYGKRSSKIEPKLDLGKKYFSSSSDQFFKTDQKNSPQNYKYKVVAIFNTSEEAINREINLHNLFDVGVNVNFYNRSKQTSNKFNFDGTGIVRPKEVGEKISKANKGVPKSAEHTAKVVATKKINGTLSQNKGVPMSEEQKEKISKANKGVPKSAEHIAKAVATKKINGTSNKGVPMSEDQKEKISKAHKGRKHSAEQIEKYIVSRKKSNKLRGKQYLSQEHKDAISLGNKGKPKSKEHREKISGENHESFIGYYISPELKTPTMARQYEIGINTKWYDCLDKLISKLSYSCSKYLNSKFNWSDIEGKTFRDIGLDFIPK